jgi:hypothetical protein
MINIANHLSKLQNQREFIWKLKNNLPPKTEKVFKVLVVQDFVSTYSQKAENVGNKVNDLVMVIYWTDKHGKRRKLFLDFFCSNKKENRTDSFFVIEVWNILLQANKELHEARKSSPDELEEKRRSIYERIKSRELLDHLLGVTHIVRTGDSGGHFHCRRTMLWESKVKETFGIEFETHTLCKRHAYSECDAHGGAGKRIVRSAVTNGYAPGEAEEYASIMNHLTLGAQGSRSYAIQKIRREEGPKIREMTGNAANLNIRIWTERITRCFSQG